MKTILNLIKKDIVRFFKDTPALILTFVVPAVLIIIFGNIFGGGNDSRGKPEIILVNESSSPAAEFLAERLDSSDILQTVKVYHKDGKEFPFTEETAKEFVSKGKITAAVVLPEDFLSDTSSGMKIKFYYDPKNEIESNLIQGGIQKTIFTEMPAIMPYLLQRQMNNLLGSDSGKIFNKKMAKLVGEALGFDPDSVFASMTQINLDKLRDSSATAQGNDLMSQLINIESEQLVGKEIKSPGVTRIVGGWAMMFLLFSLTGASISIFEEKQEGSLRRLLFMPITRSQILWSKYLYSILLGIVQLLVMYLISWAIFDVDIFSNFFNLFVVIVASAFAAVAFGMLITAMSKTIQQANGLATLIVLVMSAVGGSWFPVSLFPDWIQVISKFTITYWSVEAFLDVLWRHASLVDILPNLGVLLATAVVINYIALYLFKKRSVV